MGSCQGRALAEQLAPQGVEPIGGVSLGYMPAGRFEEAGDINVDSGHLRVVARCGRRGHRGSCTECRLERLRSTSKHKTAAAVETFRDSARPTMGMVMAPST